MIIKVIGRWLDISDVKMMLVIHSTVEKEEVRQRGRPRKRRWVDDK